MNFIKRAQEVKQLLEDQLNDHLLTMAPADLPPLHVALLVSRTPSLQDRATQIDIVDRYIEYLQEGPSVTRLGALDHFIHAYEAVVMPQGQVIRHVGILSTLRFQLTSSEYGAN